jgi:hypothetical protein
MSPMPQPPSTAANAIKPKERMWVLVRDTNTRRVKANFLPALRTGKSLNYLLFQARAPRDQLYASFSRSFTLLITCGAWIGFVM